MNTQTVSNLWYAHRSALGQALALRMILNREGVSSADMNPTLEYIQEHFTNVDQAGCENIAIKMNVPDKFKHIMVIPRRRLLRRYYWTPGRIAVNVAHLNGRHVVEKDVCRRFRSGSKSLTKVLAKSSVKYANHLIIGAHGDEDNPYAVEEKELYKRMWSDPRTEAAMDQLKEMQPEGDFVAFPFYIPREPLKTSAKNIIDGLSRGEFGLTSWMLEYAFCAQIGDTDLRTEGPFAPDVNDLEISAPGDVYAQPGTMGRRDCVTIFSWKKSMLQVDLLPVSGVRPQRPAVGFIPTEVKS